MPSLFTLLATAEPVEELARAVHELETFDLFWKAGLSLLVGALVGLERERQALERPHGLPAGIRTFPLIGLLGFLAALLAELTSFWILVAVLAGLVALVVVSHAVSAAAGFRGTTTEIAVILVFVLGTLIYFDLYMIAIGASVVLTLFLSVKEPLQQFVGRISEEDIYATLKLALITAVVLPLLPNRTLGPLDVLNPRLVWLLVVLIAGISFLGYVLVKALGPRKGLPLTGLLGGLVSSTAVTLSFSQRSREQAALSRNFAAAILLASTVMYARIFVAVAVVNPGLLPELAPFLVLLLATGLTVSRLVWWRHAGEADEEVELRNPFRLLPAVRFGILFSLILVGAKAVQLTFGEAGVLAAAGAAGLAEVDAITLSMANLAREETLGETVAVTAIILATVTNTVVKAGLTAFFGSAPLRRAALPGFAAILAAGLAVLAWLALA